MRLRLLAFALIALTAAACTPDEVRLWNYVSETDVPEPPVLDTSDREAMMTLPATFVTQDVWGETVHLIGWYGDNGQAQNSFVYEDTESRRWIITSNDGHNGYTWLLSDDPCDYDAFNGVTGTDCPDPFND